MSQTTLQPRSAAPRDPEGPRLTVSIAWHPDLSRVGESLPVGTGLRIGRQEPAFRKGPLDDPFVSRRPLTIRPSGDQVELTAGGSPIRVDGVAVQTARLGPERIDSGVVVELADRVALLLHRAPPPDDVPLLGLVGPGLDPVRRQVQQVADLDVSVLVRGESGTGKERVAQAIHHQSRRRGRPFVAVSLAALAPTTATAELFGHTRGAFTGADRARGGLFAQADGGTLFLDEVGEAPLEVQVALLRVLETGEVHRVGADRPTPVDVRVLAATDADLEAAVTGERFREPLLHRLAGFEIHLPPLRERRQDIGPLLAHFLRAELDAVGEADRLVLAGPGDDPFLGVELAAKLLRAQYRGNVRQLRNAVRQLVIASRGRDRVVRTPALDRLLDEASEPPVPTAPSAGLPDDDAIQAALAAADYRPTAAARALGVSKTWLYAWMDRAGVPKAGDLQPETIEAARAAVGDDLAAMARHLGVSRRGLQIRITELQD